MHKKGALVPFFAIRLILNTYLSFSEPTRSMTCMIWLFLIYKCENKKINNLS